MILLVLLGVLTIASAVIWKISDELSLMDIIGTFATFIFGLFFAGALIMLPISYYGTKADVYRYHSLKDTIEESRNSDISEIERAALTQEIADYNKYLASIKFWNDTIFDIYIYDGLAELEYLQ